jgi:hypothetical protein
MKKAKPERLCCTTHCCIKHGCKYGYDDCPVMLGLCPSNSCEECGLEEQGYYGQMASGMSQQEVFNFLRDNLKVRVEDDSHGSNYEVPGSLGVLVSLVLNNPYTGKEEVISTDRCSIG